MRMISKILRCFSVNTAAAVLLFLVNSCETVLFIELEEAEKLIVVNSAISNDSILVVQVSRSRHILDNAPVVPLESALVRVYREGTQIRQLTYGWNGYYIAEGFTPEIGQEYIIEVESSGYETVRARCTVPEPVQIQSVDTTTVVFEPDEGYYWGYSESSLQFDITIQDPPGEENYYLLSARVNRSYREWRDTTVIIVDSLYYGNQWNYFPRDSVYTIFDIRRYVSHPYLTTTDIVEEASTSRGILFSDKLIDGKSYSFRASVYEYDLVSADSAEVDLRLHSISESYYKYLNSRQKHYETKDNYLTVPVIVYTNVESGTGFFGGYSTDVHTITTFVPEYRGEYWYY
jgi:hypothetical protein